MREGNGACGGVQGDRVTPHQYDLTMYDLPCTPSFRFSCHKWQCDGLPAQELPHLSAAAHSRHSAE